MSKINLKGCIDLCIEIEILLQASSYSSLAASRAFKSASRRTSDYRALYEVGVSQQDFNFMLSDRSFFQFTEARNSEELRYAYYPNPYIYEDERSLRDEAQSLLNLEEITIDEYSQLVSEEYPLQISQAVRYDLSYDQYCEYKHPAAHLHLGLTEDNRWPVAKVLTPTAFFLNILRLYYSDTWHSSEMRRNRLDLLFKNELAHCNELPIEYYSEEERLRLNFS